MRSHKTYMPRLHQQRSCMQVLGTMLHELCHNEHGPHNAAFYKLLDEITAVRSASGRYGVRLVLYLLSCLMTQDNLRHQLQECDDFRARGIVGTGAGFDAASSGRLGGAGFGAHNPDPRQLRDKFLKAGGLSSLGWGWRIPGTVPWHYNVQSVSTGIAIPTCAACQVVLAVQAAAGRAQTQTLLGGGPRRLGGTSVSLPPAQARHGLQQPETEACCTGLCMNIGI